MKIALADLKKAISALEAHTNKMNVDVSVENNQFLLKSFDRNDAYIEIVLFACVKDVGEAAMHPQIKKTERL